MSLCSACWGCKNCHIFISIESLARSIVYHEVVFLYVGCRNLHRLKRNTIRSNLVLWAGNSCYPFLAQLSVNVYEYHHTNIPTRCLRIPPHEYPDQVSGGGGVVLPGSWPDCAAFFPSPRVNIRKRETSQL